MSELGKVIEELEMLAGVPHASRVYVKCYELQTLIAAAKRAEQAEAEVERLRGRIAELAEAVDNYKLAHDLNGDDSPEAGRAWFNMTSARNRAVMGSMIQPPTANEGATAPVRSWLGELQDLSKPPPKSPPSASGCGCWRQKCRCFSGRFRGSNPR